MAPYIFTERRVRKCNSLFKEFFNVAKSQASDENLAVCVRLIHYQLRAFFSYTNGSMKEETGIHDL
jgi:hypothetical protein